MSQFKFPFTEPVRDETGCVIPYAKVSFYEAGTTTAKNVFGDIWHTVPLSQPVEADRFGNLPPIFFDGFAKVDVESRDCRSILGFPMDDVSCPGAIPKYQQSQIANRVMPAILFWVTDTDPMQLRVGDCATEGGVILGRRDDLATNSNFGSVRFLKGNEAALTTFPAGTVFTPAQTVQRISEAVSGILPACTGAGEGFLLTCVNGTWQAVEDTRPVIPDCPTGLTTPMLTCTAAGLSWIEASGVATGTPTTPGEGVAACAAGRVVQGIVTNGPVLVNYVFEGSSSSSRWYTVENGENISNVTGNSSAPSFAATEVPAPSGGVVTGCQTYTDTVTSGGGQVSTVTVTAYTIPV